MLQSVARRAGLFLGPAFWLLMVALTTAVVSNRYCRWVFSSAMPTSARPAAEEGDYYAIQSVTTVGYGCKLSLPEHPDDLRGVAKAQRGTAYDMMIRRFRRLSAVAMLFGAMEWAVMAGLIVHAMTRRQGSDRSASEACRLDDSYE